MSRSERRVNPPLASRLLWRDPILPETLISRDRGLMARSFGSIFAFGGSVAAVGLLIGAAGDRRDGLILALAMIAIVLGAISFIGYRRLPILYFELMALAGTALITIAATAAEEGETVYAIFYVWIAILAGLFFRPRVAALVVAAPLVAYAIVLHERDVPFAGNYVTTMAAVLITSAVIITLLRRRIERLAQQLSSDARTDTLTGLPNRRAFEQRFEQESERSRRSGEAFSVAICDLDHFKSINDRFGHQQGDEVLSRVGAALEHAVRAVDVVARIGGEEFGVILPGADRERAHQVAERIRLAVQDEFADSELKLTASSGVATHGRDGEDRKLMRSADLALYRAKELGRDRTVSFDDGDDGRGGSREAVAAQD